ncbi:hypothetical protein B0T26DRAFT_770655 [Lasiosphaeria miniovina]|uniref:DUF2415 domain-containing protein n=1 Tax=Lasiosphaeria miniovina TaxID=1954250 RepID=A0AA40AUK6_9PEZI|nr:uncharacterized protein B0T26DRAFT_770655 [Lasiosphaeria miniovina]KAK0722308.1 hypothetical protein B0T26DRAFT_770655 [Lasiosphaeria miniovina]
MAVKHGDPTEDLILPKPRRHYRTTVRAAHWQLRSMIGTDNQNKVYYPSGTNNLIIRQLDTTTCEAESVKHLTFPPRCLVASNGWVCCGGETGEFVAVPVAGQSRLAGDGNPSINMGPDERLPINMSLPRSADFIFTSLTRARSSNKSLVAKSKIVGDERVNCITLWFPPSSGSKSPGAYQDPVAVLANNDKTVVVIRLSDQEILDKLSYPDCVNRAVLSPDGRILIAVSDDPFLYTHERTEKTGSSNSFRGVGRSTHEWTSCGMIHLKGQRIDDRTDNRGSFAACFSSSGKFLAVGTQYGTISVFSVVALTIRDLDPLITSFTSTRPKVDLGAVRDMAFAPGPSDLLAWTEDRGRVGVADARTGFVSRQILYLDQADDYDHVAVTDRQPGDSLSADPDRHDALSSSFSNTLDLSLDGGQNRRPGPEREPLERYHFPLTADETLVLEALQEHRRRQEARVRIPWAERNTRASVAQDSNTRSRERSASVSRAVSDILGNIRDQRDRIRDSQERLRATMREDSAAEQRRRGVAVSSAAGTGEHIVPVPAASSAGDWRPFVSRLSANTQTPASNSWDNVEALYNPILGVPPTEAVAAGEADVVRRRDRAAYLLREWEENPARRTQRPYPGRGYGHRYYDPADTAGLVWSEDGQTL